MEIAKLAQFELAVQDLAKAHGLELVEHGGTALLHLYDKHGHDTENVVIQLRPIKTTGVQ